MSLFSVFDISGSALQAESVRMNTTSSNLANANSISSSLGKTYRARHPVFQQLKDSFDEDNMNVGVQVAGIVESKAPLRKEYNPNNPQADAQGYVYLPNVNVAEEMANMISASRSYQTNVEVMNSAKQMLLRTITLGQ
ncbi:MAG: flagellar basal body rod protein FlgC [Gammaproteobacteria bacterium]|nr:flagellar basal body rod protein FlgC [Gammaproteobacteria bacterium]